jgi:aldose 1-epimerase
MVRLRDDVYGVEVAVMPSFGNAAVEMKVHGKDILHFPPNQGPDHRAMGGIPILAPWANRLGDSAFWANGRQYGLRMNLGNIKIDGNGLPIHGLLWKQAWDVTAIAADENSAQVTSRFDFSKRPDLMAQWPFAHDYEMTHRLADGVLETRVTVTNHSAEPMPLSLGFHPYIKIPDIPRDQWHAVIPARQHVVADQRLLPTGEFIPMGLPSPFPLVGFTLDDGFSDLERNDGTAIFSIEADGKRVEVLFGPKYEVAVVWLPESRDFICFEPMTGVTNAINLRHDGSYPSLQFIPPGQQWTESFWIRTTGM